MRARRSAGALRHIFDAPRLIPTAPRRYRLRDRSPSPHATGMALGGPERKTMTVINTNVSALRAQNNSRVAGRMQSQAMERLSHGQRINSATDDAAGLAHTTRLAPNVPGLHTPVHKPKDG